jgi:hypothetical protein
VKKKRSVRKKRHVVKKRAVPYKTFAGKIAKESPERGAFSVTFTLRKLKPNRQLR